MFSGITRAITAKAYLISICFTVSSLILLFEIKSVCVNTESCYKSIIHKLFG